MSERGVALVLALMAILLLSALGLALILTTSAESMIASNHRNAVEALYAADAAADRALDDLAVAVSWSSVFDGSERSAFVDGAPGGPRTLADASSIDLAQVVNMANCGKAAACSAAEITGNATGDRPWGPNNPVWQLFAFGPLRDLSPGSIDSPFYVVVLVADDPSENDDDPLHDGEDPAANPGAGVLMLRAEAFGPRGTHKIIELTVARPAIDASQEPGRLRVVSWRELR